MTRVQRLLEQISSETISLAVDEKHIRARSAYPYRGGRVRDWNEFEQEIGAYYAYHYTTCITGGGRLDRAEAAQSAIEILHRSRKYAGVRNAFDAAHSGNNGGLEGVFDEIRDQLMEESREKYTRHILAQHVAPISYEEKKEFVRAISREYGGALDRSLQEGNIDEYANDYERLAQLLQRTRENLSHEVRRQR